MKKILALLLVLALALGMAACGAKTEPAATEAPAANAPAADNAAVSADDIPDEMTSADGKYQVAFVTDVGTLKDKSFNQGTYDGVKLYANANGKAYKYYQPANGSNATDDDRIDAATLACENGAEVVVAAGFMQEAALKATATKYPDVHFIFIDGYPVAGDDGNVLKNVAGIAFDEQQSGYLAGYAAVMEGYTKLGFTGGGGGDNPACVRFGYGFVQGADAAAAAKGVKVDMNYSWLYGSSFSASNELQTMATGWYTNGTEVIFCCGGGMFSSVAAAAGAEDGKVIGVDVDQSYISKLIVTSAMKQLQNVTELMLDTLNKGEWETYGGKVTNFGLLEGEYVGLPTDTWSMEHFTVDEYNAVKEQIRSGEIEVSNSTEAMPEVSITVNEIA